jgi:hypothetical protein
MAATLFVKAGAEYIRVATSVLNPDGSGRAVGTVLGGAALDSIKAGKPYYGEVQVLGTPIFLTISLSKTLRGRRLLRRLQKVMPRLKAGRVRSGREMIDLLAVEEPKPKPAKIRAVSYEAAIDQLFKRMRSSSSALTQQAVSNPRRPVPNERRRRQPPHGRRTGTTGDWPPAARGSPPAPA